MATRGKEEKSGDPIVVRVPRMVGEFVDLVGTGDEAACLSLTDPEMRVLMGNADITRVLGAADRDLLLSRTEISWRIKPVILEDAYEKMARDLSRGRETVSQMKRDYQVFGTAVQMMRAGLIKVLDHEGETYLDVQADDLEVEARRIYLELGIVAYGTQQELVNPDEVFGTTLNVG